MIPEVELKNRRILVIDDNEDIHADFRKILCPESGDKDMDAAETRLFGETPGEAAILIPCFEIDSALQGPDGLEKVRESLKESRPYALVFVDVRMPPGWDGIETLERIWAEDPDIQAVICSAYSDYSWAQIVAKLKPSDRLLILKKPFDNIEVRQLVCTLTEKWNLARTARSRMENLEKAVAERTRELQQERNCLNDSLTKLQQAHAQLLQSEKMASIGQLAAGVAHEINNPIGFISSNLNSLSNYAKTLERVLGSFKGLIDECLGLASGPSEKATALRDLCQECDLDYVTSDLEKLVEESMEGARRVRQIVADLRDFSHIDSPDVAEADINKLIEKTINVAWNELKYKAEVVREFGTIPEIPCYGGKLGQVFLNLLVNAAQAIEERGRITVRTGQADECVWAEVEDTGCGIPPKSLNRLFEPFFTTKEVGKGTGMGLHLAYKIIEAHGGKITVKSESQKGTVFRVTLPLSGPPTLADKEVEHAVHAIRQ